MEALLIFGSMGVVGEGDEKQGEQIPSASSGHLPKYECDIHFPPLVNNNIKGTTLKWSQSCQARGTLLHVLCHNPWNAKKQSKITFGLGLSNLISQKIYSRR